MESKAVFFVSVAQLEKKKHTELRLGLACSPFACAKLMLFHTSTSRRHSIVVATKHASKYSKLVYLTRASRGTSGIMKLPILGGIKLDANL